MSRLREARAPGGRRRADRHAAGGRLPVHLLMIRGVFLKILLWFWVSLVLVAAHPRADHHRHHHAVRGARASLQRQRPDRPRPRGGGPARSRRNAPSVDRFFAELQHRTGIRAGAPERRRLRRSAAGRSRPTATVVATRALESGQTEMEADGQTAVKARAVTAADGRRYVLVATMPIGLLRLLHDAPSAQLFRLLAGPAHDGRSLLRPGPLRRASAGHAARGHPRSWRRATSRCAWRPAMGTRRDESSAELGRDFDAMAERAGGLDERRAPVAARHLARAALPARPAERGPRPRAPATHRRPAALDRIEREADRLNALIGQLLTLARLESGARDPARELVEVLAIVREVAEDADFEARGRRRAVQIVEAAERRGRRGRRAAAQRGRERASATRSVTPRTAPRSRSRCAGGTTTARRGEDLGPRPRRRRAPARAAVHLRAVLPRERGARAQRGRRGLGLTIAHRTVRLHGGAVSAANAPDGGLVVEIDLPRADGDLAAGAPRRPRLIPNTLYCRPAAPREVATPWR